MTYPLVVAPSSAAGGASTTDRLAGSTWRSRLFAPGWPFAWIFVGYPLWWVMGIAEFMVFAMGGVMAMHLLRRRGLHAPRGFIWWLVFLGLNLVGLLLLQVNAPGAQPGQSSGRYLVWAYRLLWLFVATVVLLYIGNMRRELPLLRVARMFSWMFLTVVVGGIAGTFFPYFQFPSLLELVLPGSITKIGFLHAMIHPNLAQLQDVLGFEGARPSAPFPYTNTWGLAYACFLPFFVYAWFSRGSGWRRLAVPVVLLASLAPVIQSLNRGLWGALIGMMLFVAVRAALQGSVRMLAAVLLGATLAGGVIAASPLGETIALRWSHQHSNEGRANLGTLAVKSTLDGSPLVGYGTTRQVRTNFNSISRAATVDCPRCSPPSLGTQGQVWLVLFTTGLIGFLSYLIFFSVQVAQGLRLRSEAATVGLCALVAHAITAPVYNASGAGLLAIMAGVAFIWRERVQAVPGGAGRVVDHSPRLTTYVDLLRRYAVLMAVLALACGGAAYAGMRAYGVPAESTAAVDVPEPPTFGERPPTLDTEAQYAASPAVLKAVAAAVDHPVVADDIYVTAAPNSRVLQFTVSERGWDKATKGARAAAAAYVTERNGRLAQERAATVARLTALVEAQQKTLRASQLQLGQLQARPGATTEQTTVLNREVDAQVTSLARESARLDRARNQALNAGTVVRDPYTRTNSSLLKIVAVTAATLGAIAGLVVGLLRELVTPRVRRGSSMRERTGLRVLGRVPTAGDARATGRRLAALGATSYHAVGTERTVLGATQDLDDALPRDHSGPAAHRAGVLLVAGPRSRYRDVLSLKDSLESCGNRVLGAVVVDDTGRRGEPRSTQHAVHEREQRI